MSPGTSTRHSRPRQNNKYTACQQRLHRLCISFDDKDPFNVLKGIAFNTSFKTPTVFLLLRLPSVAFASHSPPSFICCICVPLIALFLLPMELEHTGP